MLVVYPNWRLRQQRYHLQGTVCPDCERVYFPPRKVCRTCLKIAERLLTEWPKHVIEQAQEVGLQGLKPSG